MKIFPEESNIIQFEDIKNKKYRNNYFAEKSYKILIVEDSVQLANFLSFHITEGGESPYFYAVKAFRCRTALKILRETNIDIILLDLMLPDGDGMEILKKVKTSKKSLYAQVIILSNSADPATIRECYERGAACFLEKRYNVILTELPGKIRQAAGRLEVKLRTEELLKNF